MSRAATRLAASAAFALAFGAHAQPAPAPAPIVAPAPHFKVGAMVTDRTGARLGPIQSLAEAARGAMIVIEIDGKLVSVPQSTLKAKGGGAVSSQTKAEILAAAGAPR
ncbi:MAG: hypothetical protein ACR2FH_01710 [Caulobacteraceae bacterium]